MLVRIANRCESLALNSNVQICNQIDRVKFQDGCQNSKWPPFFIEIPSIVIIGNSLLVRIANNCKSLALNNIVQICY